MDTKIKRTIAGSVMLLALIVFTTTVARAFHLVPEPLPPSVSSTGSSSREWNKVPTPGEPSRLLIPEIEVDAPVEAVGTTQGGDMAVPWSYTAVGWYRYGTIPGDTGSAVVAGHVDSGLANGVFGRVKELKVGDDIYVLTHDGTILHFVVQSTESYPYDSVPIDVLFGKGNSEGEKPMLNLVTCDGSWVLDEATYDHRLIVFAQFESIL